MQAQRGVGVLLYPFFNFGARWVRGDQLHTPAAYPPGRDLVPI
jgi:hypothetical protein